MNNKNIAIFYRKKLKNFLSVIVGHLAPQIIIGFVLSKY